MVSHGWCRAGATDARRQKTRPSAGAYGVADSAAPSVGRTSGGAKLAPPVGCARSSSYKRALRVRDGSSDARWPK